MKIAGRATYRPRARAGILEQSLIVFAGLCWGCVTRDDAKATPSTDAALAATKPSGLSSVGSGGSTVAPATTRIEVTPSLERTCRQICDRSRQLKCSNAMKMYALLRSKRDTGDEE